MEKMKQLRGMLLELNPERTVEEAQAIIDDMALLVVDQETKAFNMSNLEVLLDRGIEIWGGK